MQRWKNLGSPTEIQVTAALLLLPRNISLRPEPCLRKGTGSQFDAWTVLMVWDLIINKNKHICHLTSFKGHMNYRLTATRPDDHQTIAKRMLQFQRQTFSWLIDKRTTLPSLILWSCILCAQCTNMEPKTTNLSTMHETDCYPTKRSRHTRWQLVSYTICH
jgi:hypothetical protein